MVKRTQSLPLNIIILAIIAIIVLVFLIGKFIPKPPRPVPPPHPIPSSNQTIAQCLQYIVEIQRQMGTSTDPSSQLQMLANSQYVSTNCSISVQYAFTLYNGSEVICGLGQKVCLNLSGSSCDPSIASPPNAILGCELK